MLSHTAEDILAFSVGGLDSGNKDQVESRTYTFIKLGVCRSDNSFAAVAFCSFANLFAGGYSDTKVICIIFYDVSNKIRGDIRATASVRSSELPILF